MKRNYMIAMAILFSMILGVAAAGLANPEIFPSNINKNAITREETKSVVVDLNDFKKQDSQNTELDLSEVHLNEQITMQLAETQTSQLQVNQLKREVAELKIDDTYLEVIGEVLSFGYTMQDILIAYRFLNEQYGNISELEGLLSEKQSKDWSEVFESYNLKYPEFIPSEDFTVEELELYLSQGMTSDDIMIADRMAQRGYASFPELIGWRMSGKSWREIKKEFQIINLEEKLKVVSVNHDEITKTMRETGLSEEAVLDAVILSKKLNVDQGELISETQYSMKKENVWEKAYELRYY